MSQKKKSSKNAKKAVPSSGGRKSTTTLVVAKSGNTPSKSARPPAHVVEAVCGLTDPFCQAAWSAKFPDNSGIRTLAYPWHSRQSMTTDVNGNATVMFLPNYEYDGSTDGTVSANGQTCTFASVLGPTTRLTGVSNYRINTAGMLIKRISAPLTSAGMVYIRGYSVHNGSGLGTISSNSYACDFSADIPLQDCKEVAVLVPRTGPNSRFWHRPTGTTPTSAITDWTTNGYAVIVVTVVGGPVSTGVLEIENRTNYELTFTDGNASQIMATKAAPASNVINYAVDVLASEAKHVFRNGMAQVGNAVRSEASAALQRMLANRMASMALIVD